MIKWIDIQSGTNPDAPWEREMLVDQALAHLAFNVLDDKIGGRCQVVRHDTQEIILQLTGCGITNDITVTGDPAEMEILDFFLTLFEEEVHPGSEVVDLLYDIQGDRQDSLRRAQEGLAEFLFNQAAERGLDLLAA